MKKILSIMFILFLVGTMLHAQEERSTEDYVNDLSSNNPSVIIAACNWLGENGKKDGNDKMMDLLTHENDQVRLWAAANLGLVGENEAVAAILEHIVRESNSDVRYAMVLAITRIGVTSDEDKQKITELKDLETNPIIKDYIAKMDEKYNGSETETETEE